MNPENNLLEQAKIFCNGCDFRKADGMCSNYIGTEDTQRRRVLEENCKWAAVDGERGIMTLEGFIADHPVVE